MANYRDDAVEGFAFNDDVFLRVFGVSTGEAFSLNDSVSSRIRNNAVEAFVLNDVIMDNWWTKTVEAFALNDAVKTSARPLNKAVETLVLNDASLSTLSNQAVEAFIFNDAAGRNEVTGNTVEAFILNDVGDHVQGLRNNAVEAFILNDVSPSRISNKVAEAFVLNDALLTTFRPVARAVEAFVLNDAISGQALKTDLTVEAFLLNDATSQHLHGVNKVVEVFYLNDVARGGEGVAWTSDVEPLAMSRYDNFPFNSMAVVNGSLMGAGPRGIFALSGDTDAGVAIQAEIAGDWTDRVVDDKGSASDRNLKRPRYVYLNASVDGVLAFVLGCLEDGAEVEYDYSLPDTTALGFVNIRAPLGRGIRSRYLRPVIRNVSGADFEINDGTIVVDSLARSL